MTNAIKATVLAVTIGFSACSSTLPYFGTMVDKQPLPPRVSDILNEVQCEIVAAVTSQDELLGALHRYQHVVNVNMTLDVTNNQGVNPSSERIK
jgi:hypothetical protein